MSCNKCADQCEEVNSSAGIPADQNKGVFNSQTRCWKCRTQLRTGRYVCESCAKEFGQSLGDQYIVHNIKEQIGDTYSPSTVARLSDYDTLALSAGYQPHPEPIRIDGYKEMYQLCRSLHGLDPEQQKNVMSRVQCRAISMPERLGLLDDVRRSGDHIPSDLPAEKLIPLLRGESVETQLRISENMKDSKHECPICNSKISNVCPRCNLPRDVSIGNENWDSPDAITQDFIRVLREQSQLKGGDLDYSLRKAEQVMNGVAAIVVDFDYDMAISETMYAMDILTESDDPVFKSVGSQYHSYVKNLFDDYGIESEQVWDEEDEEDTTAWDYGIDWESDPSDYQIYRSGGNNYHWSSKSGRTTSYRSSSSSSSSNNSNPWDTWGASKMENGVKTISGKTGIDTAADTTVFMIDGKGDDAYTGHGATVMAGGTRIDMKELRKQYEAADVIYLPGGADITPSMYGEQEIPECGVTRPYRDEREIQLAKWAIEDGKPMIGICRGHQLITVAAGGTLYQDLGSQRPDTDNHRNTRHNVRIDPTSRLARHYGVTSEDQLVEVNSYHHQATKDVPPGWRAVAWSEEGVVEAIEHDKLPIVSVQFHPEKELNDPVNQVFFSSVMDGTYFDESSNDTNEPKDAQSADNISPQTVKQIGKSSWTVQTHTTEEVEKRASIDTDYKRVQDLLYNGGLQKAYETRQNNFRVLMNEQLSEDTTLIENGGYIQVNSEGNDYTTVDNPPNVDKLNLYYIPSKTGSEELLDWVERTEALAQEQDLHIRSLQEQDLNKEEYLLDERATELDEDVSKRTAIDILTAIYSHLDADSWIANNMCVARSKDGEWSIVSEDDAPKNAPDLFTKPDYRNHNYKVDSYPLSSPLQRHEKGDLEQAIVFAKAIVETNYKHKYYYHGDEKSLPNRKDLW